MQHFFLFSFVEYANHFPEKTGTLYKNLVSRYINYYQPIKITFLLFYAVLRTQLYCTSPSVSLNLHNNSYPVLYKPVTVS